MKNLLLALLMVCCVGCTEELKIGENAHYEVTMVTSEGDIRLTLFNDTPIHRDNFIRLAQEGFYDNLAFHRVIEGFVIQAGNPNSRVVSDSVVYAGKEPDYTLPPEILPHYFHKKGVLATARMGDDVNPARMSSGSQFYLVLGQVQTDSMLTVAAAQIAQRGGATLTPERIEVYKTLGGTPRLDGSYTIFGEIINGMDVAETINRVPTNEADSPLDVVLLKDVLVETVRNK